MGYYSYFTGEIEVVSTVYLDPHFVQLWNNIVEGNEDPPDGWPNPLEIRRGKFSVRNEHPAWAPWYLAHDRIGTAEIVNGETHGKWYDADVQLRYLARVLNQEQPEVRFSNQHQFRRDGEETEDIQFYRFQYREGVGYVPLTAVAIITPSDWDEI